MLLVYLLIIITTCIAVNHAWVTSRLRGEQPCKSETRTFNTGAARWARYSHEVAGATRSANEESETRIYTSTFVTRRHKNS